MGGSKITSPKVTYLGAATGGSDISYLPLLVPLALIEFYIVEEILLCFTLTLHLFLMTFLRFMFGFVMRLMRFFGAVRSVGLFRLFNFVHLVRLLRFPFVIASGWIVMFFGMFASGKIGLTCFQRLFVRLWFVLERFQLGQGGDSAFADDIVRGLL